MRRDSEIAIFSFFRIMNVWKKLIRRFQLSSYGRQVFLTSKSLFLLESITFNMLWELWVCCSESWDILYKIVCEWITINFGVTNRPCWIVIIHQFRAKTIEIWKFRQTNLFLECAKWIFTLFYWLERGSPRFWDLSQCTIPGHNSFKSLFYCE